MIIRRRKLKISENHTQETLVRINKKYEKRETNREANALKAAQVERAIEKELLSRLKVGTFYKDIYNLDQKDFEKGLDEVEVSERDEYEADDMEEEEDDSELGGDLEIGDEERRMLELAEAEDNDSDDIEELANKITGIKRKPVQIKMEDELEIEYENEDQIKPKGKAMKAKNHKRPK
jgi:protein MAK16